MRFRTLLLSFSVLLVILGGCTATPKSIEGAERDAVLAYTEPKVDNELNALNVNDYQAFIKDYNEAMIKATTPENFSKLQTLISSKLGSYLSREVVSVASLGDAATIIIYSSQFENEQGVTIRVVFESGGEHLITGLWFDSPLLRK